MTKAEALEAAARGEGALGKAAPDEPVFVLRANDPLAYDAVMYWAARATATRVHEPKKAEDAALVARAMSNWRQERDRRRVLEKSAAASTLVAEDGTRVLIPDPPKEGGS